MIRSLCALVWLLVAGSALGADADVLDVPDAAQLDAAINSAYSDREFERALKLIEDLRSRRVALLGPTSPKVALSDKDLAVLNGVLGRHEEALRAYGRALGLLEVVRGLDHPDVGAVLIQRSTFWYRQGQMDRAEDDVSRGLAMLPADHPKLAFGLKNLAFMLRNRGDYAGAEAMHNRALALRLEQLGASHPRTVSVAVAIAATQLDGRQLGIACASADDAVQFASEVFDEGDHRAFSALLVRARCRIRQVDLAGAMEDLVVARRLVGAQANYDMAGTYLGQIHYFRGDYQTAYEVMKPAVVRSGQTNNLGPFLRMWLGKVLLAQGRLAEAEVHLEDSESRLLKSMGRGSLEHLQALTALADLRATQGRSADAETGYRAIVELMGPDRPPYFQALAPQAQLGGLLLRRGEVREGLARMRAAVVNARAYYGARSPAVLAVLVPLLEALESVGEPAEARSYLQEAMMLHAYWQTESMASTTDRQALAAAALSRRLQDVALRILAHPGDDADAWHVVLTMKGAGRRSIEHARGNVARDAKLLGVRQELQRVRTERGHRQLAGLDDGEQLRTQAAIERRLAAVSGDRVVSAPTAARLRAALPRGTVLIDMVVVRGAGQPHLLAFVVTRSEVRQVDLGPVQPIERAVRRHARGLQVGTLPTDVVNNASIEVRERLWDPLNVGPERDVWWVPDGPMARLSMAALVGDDGKYLVEKRVFRVLEDARDVLRARARATSSGGAALVVGDLDYGRGSSSGCAPGPFSALPGTAVEAREVSDHLDVSALTGVGVTAEAVRELLPAARVAHFATHGFYVDRCASNQGLDSLSLSGLALSGANEGPSGVLTGAQLLDLDLSKTELIVLSACSTAAGRDEVGEGVVGLRWALREAGAGGLMMALWEVDDAATLALMQDFYARWRPGRDPAVALAMAQRRTLKRQRRTGQNSTTWAAFLVSGGLPAR
ncbi:MAG: tetratricopeptide (TPR) repeat protein [Kiritimatiellia bacterium]|jgi:tetratricopeptide (TPR) repeat protein